MTREATSRTGAAGAFAVAAELSLRGWDASPTFGNAPDVDLIARSSKGLLASIQVKAKRGKDFSMGTTGERPAEPADNAWFILVSLDASEDRQHQFFIVPRDHVVAAVTVAKAAAGLKDTRNLLGPQEFQEYFEAWELLDRPASEAPWMLPSWVHEHARSFPPPGDIVVPDPHR